MIDYSQVQSSVRHLDSQTIVTIKTFISFEYPCPYILIPIRCTYITSIVKAVELGAEDPEHSSELHNLGFLSLFSRDKTEQLFHFVY